jgi:superfamily I DNA/RNA helicase
MAWDEGISGVQKEIAQSPSKLISVLAGLGTGKTTYGLMRRVAYLLEHGVDAASILLITFTRNAAGDLKDKLLDLGVLGADNVRACTLHSFCLQLLNDEAVFHETRRHPRMLLDHERDLMLRDLPGDWGTLHERKRKLLEYVAGWDTGRAAHPGLAELPEDRAFEQEVLAWLRHHHAMLIGEVVPIAYNYLVNDPLNEGRTQYAHVIVDEYQDLNFIEQRLVDLISFDDDTSICIVGDDDQSIYGFRHALPQGILDFRQREGIKNFSINVSGRCPDTVITMANSLIAQAPGRSKPELRSRDSKPGHVAIVQWFTLDEEVEGIAAAIASDIATERFEPGQILVLTNRQYIGKLLKSRLNDLQIDAQSFFSQEPLKRESAQLALATLRLMSGEDKVAVRVLLGAGDKTGRTQAYSVLREDAQGVGKSEWDLLNKIVQKKHKPSRRIPALTDNYRRATQLLSALKGLELVEVVDKLLPEGNDGTEELRQLALDCLPLVEDVNGLVQMLVGRLALLEVPANPNFVRIMSLHKSKGLTADCVYIMGAVQGIIPFLKFGNTDKENEDAVIEHRRLMYVALTRAASQLVISYPRSMPSALVRSWGLKPLRSEGKAMVQMMPTVYLTELGSAAPERMPGKRWIDSYPPTE